MQTNNHPLLQEILGVLKKSNTLTKEIISFTEACEYLDLSPSYLYKLTANRKVPFYIPNGKKLYFKREELDKWLTRNKVDTAEEIGKTSIDGFIKNQSI